MQKTAVKTSHCLQTKEKGESLSPLLLRFLSDAQDTPQMKNVFQLSFILIFEIQILPPR